MTIAGIRQPVRNHFLWLVVGACIFLFPNTAVVRARLRGENGNFSLLVAVPLTKDGKVELDPGLFHLAAARLAIDHFNTRNSSVISDLESQTKDCVVLLDNVQVVDTGTDTHRALETIAKQLPVAPDAIAGPYNEIPALELSVLGTAFQTPIVSHRTQSFNLLLPQQHPYFSQIGADVESEMNFVATYLESIAQRTDYIALLHSAAPSIVQKVQVLQRILRRKRRKQRQTDGQDIFSQVRTFSYNPSYLNLENYVQEDDSMRSMLEDIRETGFRTILWLPSFLVEDAIELGPKVTQAGLDKDRFWVTVEGLDSRNGFEFWNFSQNMLTKYNGKFLNGSMYLYPFDGYNLHPTIDFRDHLLHQDTSFFGRVVELLPSGIASHDLIVESFNGSNTTTSAFPLQRLAQELRSWAPGSAFMYDAVITIGIGACRAMKTKRQNETGIFGEKHLKSIRSVDFVGASGPIRFGGSKAPFPGSRVGSSIPFMATNFVAVNGSDSLTNRHIGSLDPHTGEWKELLLPIYANGGTEGPGLLRDEPDRNYITLGARVFGLTLFGIAIVIVFVSFCWVLANRRNTVVVAAQPLFLYMLCLASALMCLCILLSAFEESWGFSIGTLDCFCFTWAWLDALGRMITYGALFTKLWRANRFLRFKTNQVAAWRILWPCALLVVGVLSCLTLWTVKSDYGWVRKEIDGVTGESIGLCSGEVSDLYFAPIYLFNFVTIVLACIMAWRALGIDDSYSDSKWVLAFILVQIQVLLVSAPVIIILNDTNPSGRYVGLSLVTFSFPVSSMGLIIFPKVMAVRKGRRTPPACSSTADDENESPRIQSSPPLQGSQRNGPQIQVVTFD